MIRTALSALLAVAFLMPAVSPAWAHGGGLDRHGCHRETATGGYHCHRGDDDDVDWATIGYIAGGLVVLVILARSMKFYRLRPAVAPVDKPVDSWWQRLEFRPYATNQDYGLRVYTGLRF